MSAIPRSPPVLRSPRLTLEPLRPDHVPALFDGLSDPALYRFIPDRPPASPAELSRRIAEPGSGRSPDGADIWCSWMIRHGATYVGTVQATIEQAGEQAGDQAGNQAGDQAGRRAGGQAGREPATGLLGIMVFPPFWRRGIAIEALRCLLDCLFERYDCHVAAALVDTRNDPSLGLFARLGFETVRTILDADFFDDRISHEVELALTRAAWHARTGTV